MSLYSRHDGAGGGNISNNPSDIRIFPFSSYNKEDIAKLINNILAGGLLRKDKFAIILDSDQLIKDLCNQFLHGSRSNREISTPIVRNDHLMASIVKGVGYIIDTSTPQDNMVVSELFNSGKIKLLLATFAIGNYPIAGIKEMYLTRIPSDLNELAKIVNKVGGQPGMSGSIYAESKFIELVKKALELTPEEYNVDSGGRVVKGIFNAIFKK